ncbi:AraC-type DNA-binding protein [Sporobacter termitidis DSM 10068]|uniref:AraC-type DNA-binding protein n=1 Tax=Sporobacter termitidis DSM 10068 TaxID=1123282 RepID=A0A1M5TZ46_9FIRM|nr:helix-turn-helix domain-containing protein [Sporobacter termitidis]SHH55880.1 AraC-type DNA-binding protein [Sporobacter termitidis DSM 10068]
MQIPDIIKGSLDYIERNLKTDITAEELARMANYSTFHYYRLFSSVMDASVASYILKRRLDHALSEIAVGRKAIEVVMEYGFDTYAGFYKAFMKMYGCSPKKFIAIYGKHTPKIPEVATMYTEKELRKILENWDIEKNLPIEDICIPDGAKPSGSDWTVGGYVLRTGDREKLLKDIKIAEALDCQGFASALPVPTTAGGAYLDGREVFILTHRLQGSPLSKPERFGDRRTAVGEEYGAGIARLHRALKEVQNDVSPDDVDLYRIVTDWALPNFRQQNVQWNMGLDERFFRDYLDGFGRLYGKLPRQLVHRNPHPGNILFSDGAVSGFINFDMGEVNIRLWDVCYCSTGLLSETDEENYEKWLDVLGGILRGYDRENRLTTEEKQAIFPVILSIQMVFAVYLEGREELRPLGDTNRKMLKFIVRHKTEIDRLI